VCPAPPLQIALDIACGVSHIHSKNIIHGDLSPANVLLKTDENRVGILKAVAKVGDFGLSRTIAAGKDAISGVRQGTPFYTAPEVCKVPASMLHRCLLEKELPRSGQPACCPPRLPMADSSHTGCSTSHMHRC
jgi:serine/threonine protein kinase